MSKKATKPQKEIHTYNTGDPVLGKVRGYPPWPGIVVDPADAPPAVLNEQPANKTGAHYCVLFFPKGDYSWLPSKELSRLQPHEIDAFLADETKKRNGDLREGYKIARDPQVWMANRQEVVEAEKDEKDDAQIDELESGDDEEEGPSKKAKSASRKRKRESDMEPSKSTKKSAKATKGAADSTKKKAIPSSTKGKKNGAKSKAVVESEDEGDKGGADDDDEDAGPSKNTSPPPAKKVKHDKEEGGDDAKDADSQSIKVRDWRHKLQKTFLSNKAPPKADAMPELDELFTTVEKYEEMTIEQLQFSKIGKVMRHIASLSDDKVPPRDDEFKFRARAKGLVDKWHQILNANKATNGSPSASGTAQANGKPASSGDKKDEEDVTKGTERLDLNGKDITTTSETHAIVPVATEGQAEDEQDAPAEADTSVLADVTMSEA